MTNNLAQTPNKREKRGKKKEGKKQI